MLFEKVVDAALKLYTYTFGSNFYVMSFDRVNLENMIFFSHFFNLVKLFLIAKFISKIQNN